MTAYAIKGDRQRCLAAGMDEYVSKPISSKKLFGAIEALLPRESKPESIAEADAHTLAKQSLLKAFDHDWDLFKELVDIFSSDYPGMLNTMREAYHSQDTETLSRTAHSLKGMLRNFQAEAAADTAFYLEKKAKEQKMKALDQIIEKLAKQTAAVDKLLQDLVSQKK
jgi:HPt (histidine-containing phosphotransfer) domain-containing protein